MNRLSLRWQITLWAALATVLVLATSGTVVVFEIYAQQVETIDAQLATDAGLAFAAQAGGVERMEADLARLTGLPRGEFSLRGYAFRTADRPAAAQAHPAGLAGFLDAARGRRVFFSRRIDQRWMRIGVFTNAGTTLVLATSLHRAIDGVADLLGAFAIAAPLVLLLVAGGSWWIARRALRPIVDITAATATITAHRLHERLPVPAAADEIARHIEVLNDMLNRLQRSFEQATRFTADAAHELRTPLTIMRGQLEDALQSGALNPDQEHLLVGLLEETASLQRIAENLLLLARFDSDRNPLQLAELDLSALAREAAEDAEMLAAPKSIRITAQIEPAIAVRGDRMMLRRVALNLLDNAVKFNRPGGELKLDLLKTGSDAILTIANTGPGIPPERRAGLFERFYRIATDRSRETGGSGLGLSLCREIVTAHGGRILLDYSDGEWTSFSVFLSAIAPRKVAAAETAAPG